MARSISRNSASNWLGEAGHVPTENSPPPLGRPTRRRLTGLTTAEITESATTPTTVKDGLSAQRAPPRPD
jgi:hypothetical protein